MNLLNLFRRDIDPTLEDEETEEEREDRLIEAGLHIACSPARERALTWTAAPPTGPGWFWCRFAGTTKAEPIYVAANVEIQPGRVEWSSATIQMPK